MATITSYVSFDIETTGFEKYEGDKIFAFVLTYWNGKSKVYRLDGKKKKRKKNKIILQTFLNDTSIAKIAHNAKFELSFCRAVGYNVPTDTVWHDTLLLAKVLYNQQKKYTLDYLAKIIFKYPTIYDELVKAQSAMHRAKIKAYNKENNIKTKINLGGYNLVNETLMHKYQIADGERAMLLYQYFMPLVFNDKDLYRNYLYEIASLLPACIMEENGMLYDQKQHNILYKELESKKKYIDFKIKKHLGYTFNYSSSPKKIKLMEDLGIKLTKRTKPTKNNKRGNLAVDKLVLADLRAKHKNPIFDMLIQGISYKGGLSKLNGYEKLKHSVHGIMHPNINTMQAVTGRESVSNPNLQNISKEVSLNALYGIPARKCFRADYGCIWVLTDYEGIELRLIADAVKELEYMQVIKDNGDVHGLTGEALYFDDWPLLIELAKNSTGYKIPKWIKKINQKDYNDDFGELFYKVRSGCKGFVFGNSYGGQFKVVTAPLMGLDDKAKHKGVDNFYLKYPKLANFAVDNMNKVKERGYVETPFGARLYIADKHAYMAANHLIQGTASGILKHGKNNFYDYQCATYGEFAFDPQRKNISPLRAVISVHDENVVSFHHSIFKNIERDLAALRHAMITHKEIKVPLEVSFDYTATNWAAKKKFKLDEFKKRFNVK